MNLMWTTSMITDLGANSKFNTIENSRISSNPNVTLTIIDTAIYKMNQRQ